MINACKTTYNGCHGYVTLCMGRSKKKAGIQLYPKTLKSCYYYNAHKPSTQMSVYIGANDDSFQPTM